MNFTPAHFYLLLCLVHYPWSFLSKYNCFIFQTELASINNVQSVKKHISGLFSKSSLHMSLHIRQKQRCSVRTSLLRFVQSRSEPSASSLCLITVPQSRGNGAETRKTPFYLSPVPKLQLLSNCSFAAFVSRLVRTQRQRRDQAGLTAEREREED